MNNIKLLTNIVLFYIYLFLVFLLILPIMCKATNVNSGDTIQLTATASDVDCNSPGDPNDCSTVSDSVTVTWSDDTGRATATAFPNGNTGTAVDWKAPTVCSDENVVISATADDAAVKYNDPAVSDNVTVTVVPYPSISIVQSKDLWWFNGENPANYDIAVTLTAQGATTGTFEWDVTAGASKVNLNNGGADSDNIVAVDDNTVTLKSTAASGSLNDVSIRVKHNGCVKDTLQTEVYAPDHLDHIDNNDVAWYDGYKSEIKYQTMDQFDHILPYAVEVDEVFTSSCIVDYPGGADWGQPDDSGTPLLNPTWEDVIISRGGEWYDPDPQNPQDPLGNTKVDHWSGDWYIGSQTDGSGVHVKSCIWQRYLDHARHE